jgi:hypothetical protein
MLITIIELRDIVKRYTESINCPENAEHQLRDAILTESCKSQCPAFCFALMGGGGAVPDSHNSWNTKLSASSSHTLAAAPFPVANHNA